MKGISWAASVAAVLCVVLVGGHGMADQSNHWVKINAKNKQQRTAIANTGFTIEFVGEDHVTGLATPEELNVLKQNFDVEVSFAMTADMLDYPAKDSKFHNYDLLDHDPKIAMHNRYSNIILQKQKNN